MAECRASAIRPPPSAISPMPRKPFLLRIDAQLLDALQRWSADDMRSLNGQIEFVLRDALKRAGRLPHRDALEPAESAEQDQE